MHKLCILYSIPRALQHGNRKGGAKGRSRHKNNRKRVVKNLREMDEGTKGKSPNQGLNSAEDITIDLIEGRESPYYRSD